MNFNYDQSSWSDDPNMDMYHIPQHPPDPWRTYRRSSTELSASLNSYNEFADDDQGDDDESFHYEYLGAPVQTTICGSWCDIKAVYVIAFLLFLVASAVFILLFQLSRDQSVLESHN